MNEKGKTKDPQGSIANASVRTPPRAVRGGAYMRAKTILVLHTKYQKRMTLENPSMRGRVARDVHAGIQILHRIRLSTVLYIEYATRETDRKQKVREGLG